MILLTLLYQYKCFTLMFSLFMSIFKNLPFMMYNQFTQKSKNININYKYVDVQRSLQQCDELRYRTVELFSIKRPSSAEN